MSSGPRKGAAPPPPQGAVVKGSPKDSSQISVEDTDSYKNGSGPPSITYSNSTDGDENINELSDDFSVDLRVILPNGNLAAMEVDSNIPMIDLLVHLAGRARLNPAGHKLIVISEETGKTIDYKANQTIGSLGIDTIHLVDKKAVNEKNKRNIYIHPVTNKEQPFEMTYRLTVNLPRNQKSVIRINPKVQLQHLFRDVCEDKNLDPQKYTLQHPAKPDHPLDPRMTVGDLNSNEINLVPANTLSEHAISMPDLRRSESSRVASTPQGTPQFMPGMGSEKKKSRIFSFFKKEKKYKPQGASFTETPPTTTQPPKPTGGSPQLRRSAEKPKQDRPKTMYAGMPPEGNGHLQTRSNSNGQLPQDTGATPKIVQSQTLQRPSASHRGAASTSPQSQTIASHTLPKPAGKSPAKGHGKKRQAPPPPQISPANQAQQNTPTVTPQQPPSQPQSPASISSPPPSVPPPQVSHSPPQPVNGSPSAKTTHELPVRSDSEEKMDKISSTSTKDGISEGADVNIAVNQNNSSDNVEITDSKSGEISVNVETGVSKRPHEHSRTSSDSSGYHEATLSGPESPEANRPLSLNYRKDTSMDSASIESSENAASETPETNVPTPVSNHPTAAPLNIPSLRSQMRNRDDEDEITHTVPGDYVTLPRNRIDKKAKEVEQKKDGLTRSHSLEKVAKVPPVQRKKKAPAPPPPPQAGASPKLSKSKSSESQSSLGHSPSESLSLSVHQSNKEQYDAPPSVNGHVEKAESTEELQQKGAEKTLSSLQAEDGQRHSRSQPPLFIPPPPPDTPPPPETPPIAQSSAKLIDERQVIDISTATAEVSSVASTTTTETELNNSINTEGAELEVSLTTDGAGLNTSITSDKSTSSKSSPKSSHSRCESRTSKTSISTIDDVNLAFDETIALAEEVWGKSLEGPEVERETNKVITKESPSHSPRSSEDKETVSKATNVSSQLETNIEPVKDTKVENEIKHSSESVDTDDVVFRGRSHDDGLTSGDFLQGDKGVSEITYDFKVDSVPPGFTGEPNSRQSMSEEEEVITYIEEEVVFTGPSELIQMYKDDAKIKRHWEKDLDKELAKSIEIHESPVPGATVPDWDTAARDGSPGAQPPQIVEQTPPADTIVRAKMVMVEPEPRDPLPTPYSLETSTSSSRERNKQVSSSEDASQRTKSQELKSNDSNRESNKQVSSSEDASQRTKSQELKSNDSKVDKSDSLLRYIREEAKIRHRRQPEMSREKEEFVFAKSDLNKLDFLGGRKPKKAFIQVLPPVSPPKVQPNTTCKERSVTSPLEAARISSRPSKSFMLPQPYRSPSFQSEAASTQSSSTNNVSSLELKSNNRSDLNFVPTTESEAENVLEEKSISMINLPATRVSSSVRNTGSPSVNNRTNTTNVTSVSSVKLSEKPSSSPSWSASRTENNTDQSSHRNNVDKTKEPVSQTLAFNQQELVNEQYNQLQDQFAVWQQQLVQNQALLAQHKIMPEDQSQQLQQLQVQLQLQQQMMEQLQQSMQALALQGAVTGTLQPVVQMQAPQTAAPVPPVAPPPPAAPAVSPVVKSASRTSSKSKHKKRFERQLDPREELMLAVRQASGRNCLKKVTVKEARWTNKPLTGEQQNTNSTF